MSSKIGLLIKEDLWVSSKLFHYRITWKLAVQEIDLLIIGSGPAGLSTALHLLQKDTGWAERMIVVEKAIHPRPKLCAGGVTRIGLKALRDLDFQIPLPIPGVEIEDARLQYKKRVIHVRGQPAIVIYNRIEFDAYLAQEARQRGVEIQEGEAVQYINVGSRGVEVVTTRDKYRAKVVVGADGSTGITRRLFGKNDSKGSVARVLEAVYPAQATHDQFVERSARLDFTPVLQDLQGYFWDFPSRVTGEPHFNRGVYDSRFIREGQKAKLPIIFEAELNNLGEDGKSAEFQGNPIHWFSPGNRFAMPRLLLVGDAAGVDPLLGEGIGPALVYGKVASEALIAAFRQEDFSFGNYRTRILRSVVGRNLLFRWCLAWVTYRLKRNSAFMHTLWTVGQLITTFWSPTIPKYASSSQEPGRKSEDRKRHYAD